MSHCGILAAFYIVFVFFLSYFAFTAVPLSHIKTLTVFLTHFAFDSLLHFLIFLIHLPIPSPLRATAPLSPHNFPLHPQTPERQTSVLTDVLLALAPGNIQLYIYTHSA